LRRGVQHRVLARDLIGVGWHPKRLFDPAHDIEIRHAGLDHDHVGPLLKVERHLAQGLVGVGRVHLVGALVGAAERGFRPDRVAERSVKCRGVFCRIGHDADMRKAGLVEGVAHCSDAAIHHV
jgi:hypothetical protein